MLKEIDGRLEIVMKCIQCGKIMIDDGGAEVCDECLPPVEEEENDGCDKVSNC